MVPPRFDSEAGANPARAGSTNTKETDMGQSHYSLRGENGVRVSAVGMYTSRIASTIDGFLRAGHKFESVKIWKSEGAGFDSGLNKEKRLATVFTKNRTVKFEPDCPPYLRKCLLAHFTDFSKDPDLIERCHSAITTALEFVNEESEQLTAEEFLTWLCEPQDDGSSPIGTSRLIKFAQDALEDKKAGYPQSTLADRFSYGWLVEAAGQIVTDELVCLEKISVEQIERAAIEFQSAMSDGSGVFLCAIESIETALREVPDSDGTVWIDTVTGKAISGE